MDLVGYLNIITSNLNFIILHIIIFHRQFFSNEREDVSSLKICNVRRPEDRRLHLVVETRRKHLLSRLRKTEVLFGV